MQIQLNELMKTIKGQEAKLNDKERRDSFRLRLENKTCEFQLLNVGNKNINPLKKGKAIISDISYTGMKLICPYNLPIQQGVEIKLYFNLSNRDFVLKSKIVRKEEYSDKSHYIYGVVFTETDERTNDKLTIVLREIEMEQRRISEPRLYTPNRLNSL
ncbi:PilZ domain-containing protein [Oceanobacillus halophilus]|uniref:PilZ domain-containing protein n=1 Tax=Oceanobacillus halophilus TaxID=930130 RepID=UPI001314CEEC|nr:PilZ domain-containing protein [Oceanobacillus halophilus]